MESIIYKDEGPMDWLKEKQMTSKKAGQEHHKTKI